MTAKIVTVAVLSALLIMFFSGCTTKNTKQLLGAAVANTTDTKVGYDRPSCFVVLQQCRDGDYQEWETSDGVPGCSCKIYKYRH